ncbi:tetratricopeptide repeat protein [Haloferula sp.]|uniref:tetratricopeptide repeat protein n=1 Tax=Haloferula sp. TaxID=2497595 RepID=UPI003C707A2E
MKPLLTHLFAAALGILAVVLWPSGTADSDAATADGRMPGRNESRPGIVLRPSVRPGGNQPTIDSELSKPVTGKELEPWLESKKGDSRSFAEALVIAGLLTNDPDLIRQGIEADPANRHLLFIGATFSAFSGEERLAMSKRLLAADPDNALAAFISASHLLDAGQSDAAIEILRGTTDRYRMDDFRIATQLGTEDAYIAAGLSPDAAKIRSAFDFKLGYLSDLRSLANSLKDMEGSRSPEEASELRSLTASMGQRLADQSRSGTMIDQFVGMALEEATLSGLSDEAPSLYEGLTVSQARESIVAERQELRQVIENFGNAQDILSNDPDLMSRYIDHLRLRGELEAAKWLVGETESSR